MARFFFCFVPALLIAVVVALIHPALGFLAFAGVFHVGLHATKARPERGEL